MRLEIIVEDAQTSTTLDNKPPKDGTITQYACGLILMGSWASRLEQHSSFCATPIGKYILEMEKENRKLLNAALSKFKTKQS